MKRGSLTLVAVSQWVPCTVTGNKTTASLLAAFTRRKKADCFQTRICFHRHASLAFSLLLSPSPPPPPLPAPPLVLQSSRSVVGSNERDLNTRRRTFLPPFLFFPPLFIFFIFFSAPVPRRFVYTKTRSSRSSL